MNSVLPPISSAAWASFSTGVNPGGHGIFGFVERDPQTMRTRLVNARDLIALPLWARLNRAGKRVIVMNVPMTYPPCEINGIMISGFLAPDLPRAVFPHSILPRLERLGYRIDPDHTLGLSDRKRYLDGILGTLRARYRAVLDLMGEPWDFFMAHVMMTDRINHFFWADGENEKAAFHSEFLEFYSMVDRFVGEVVDRLPRDVQLVLLSDHGFCHLRFEVDLNAYLVEGGFLRFKDDGEGLPRIDPSSHAYSLLPGRIYVNLQGRERMGSVKQEDYDRVRDDLATYLTELKDGTGKPAISHVFRKEEVYHGKAFDHAPDLIALPNDGYDLKARFSPGEVFSESTGRTGMHTYPDAFVLVPGTRVHAGGAIFDVTATILTLYGFPIPETFDGRSLLPAGR